MAKKKPPYVPPKYRLQVNSLFDLGINPTTLFNKILADYCARFKVEVRPERVKSKIMLSLIDTEDGNAMGMCIFDGEPKPTTTSLVIQVVCPVLAGESISTFTGNFFTEVLCHEMVHACQALTGRVGIIVEGETLGNNKAEPYFFDPAEVEARMLQAYYANAVGRKEVHAMLDNLHKHQSGFMSLF